MKPDSVQLPPMTAWLDVLRAALPPTGVLLAGAGSGDGPWVQWLKSRDVASHGVSVHLIEGDEQQYRHLQQCSPTDANWIVRRDVVAAAGGTVTFHRASNPAESGLLKPESLRDLWPHLGTEEAIVIDDAITLDTLHEEAGGQINWLLLDCLPATSLLQGATQLLSQLEVVLVRVVAADVGLRVELLAGEQGADELLLAAGFRRIHTHAERHPAVAHALYVHDAIRQGRRQVKEMSERLKGAQGAWRKERAELTLAMETAGQKAVAAEQAKALAQKEAKRLREQLKAAQEVWGKEKAELTRSIEAAGQETAAAQQARETARSEAKERSEQLKAAQEVWTKEKAELARGAQMAAPISNTTEQAHKQEGIEFDAYQQSIKNLEKQLRSNFGKDLKNAIKQIEAFISIQNYLNAGDSVSSFHGWPISPDLGLFLIEHIRERHHDLIIEFGSGTSTALFARALQMRRRASALRAVATEGVARPICSFEHDQVYLRKTRQMLDSNELASMVALNYAPLLDWQDDTGRYLYYDCDATLAALAQQLSDSPKRVLVLVDGPPGTTCANARYPAVPLIFKHFARHEIDVVLDDANRAEEKAVVELWRAFWKQRSIRISETTVPSEKGLYLALNWQSA